MEVLECLKCKGQIQLNENGLTGKCLSCDTLYHFKAEKSSRIIALLNQANIARLRGDFDEATLAYKIALKEDDTDADAYWGLALSKFGIDYIDDERTKTIKPTCRRTISYSILEDENYLKALSNASTEQAQDFEAKAKEIDDLQNAIKEKIKTESDYDVFLCYKSTDADGNVTADRLIARNIYEQLEKRGIKTFFAEISLKDRLGHDYEPIIYKAIYTASVFILIATKEEYIQAPWVRNEWVRFRDRIADENLFNASFAVFKDIKNNQLPPIFRSQGVDLSKYPVGGYEVEIADNLTTRLKQKKFSSLNNNLEDIFKESSSQGLEDKVVDLLEKKLATTRQTYDEKIERVVTYNEIGQKEKAISIINDIIDEYPRKSLSWFIKAKLLTSNFEIDAVEYYLNNELQTEVNYCIDNALRFATQEEKTVFEESINPLKQKVLVLQGQTQNLQALEESLKEYSVLSFQQKFESKNQEAKNESSKDGYIQALEENKKEAKKLKKQILNKNYYIKNSKPQPGLIKSFFSFVAFIAVATALIVSIIKLAEAVNKNESVLPVILELTLLLLIGFLPIIILKIIQKQIRLSKVKHVIERDRVMYQSLIEQNKVLKKHIENFDKPKQNDFSEKQSDSEELITALKKHIAELYKKTKKHFITYDFVKKYILQYEDFANKEFQKLIKETQLEISTLNIEKEKLLNANSVLKKEIVLQKPKYFSSEYEKFVLNNENQVRKNNNKINLIEKDIRQYKINLENFNLQIKHKISNDNFFEDFLPEYQQSVEKYLLEKEQEKNAENQASNDIIKPEIKVVKTVKFKNKKLKNKKRR